MYLLFLSLLIFLLVLCSYFFSGAETSITSINTARIHELKNKGNKKAYIVATLQAHKERVLGVILLGNTLVNITASAIATTIFVDSFQDQTFAVTISSVTMTFVILLFAEVLPKTYAVYNPEKVALFSAPIIRVIEIILTPVIRIIQKMVDLILRILSLHNDKEFISAADAMRNLIAFHKHDRTMLKQDLDMLSSVLDLAETEISAVITHRKDMVAVNIDLDKEVIINNILDSKHTNVPLWRDNPDNIEGIINVYDLILELRRSQSYSEIDIDKLIHKPIFVPDTTPLSKQLHNFRLNKNNFALAVDEYGSLQGVVTLSDILEEIVGDIYYDDAESITNTSKNQYNISGKVSIRDLNRKLGWQLPEDEASTIAGVIVHALERIPDVNEEFDLFGVHFKVLKKDGNFITKIKAIVQNK